MADVQFCSVGAQAPLGTERFLVQDGAVLFSGTTGATPVAGAGTRMMWIPAKAAFRAGIVTGTAWDDANIGTYTAAFGTDCQATATQAFAWGSGSIASGQASFAGGYSCTASGVFSVSLGNFALASLAAQFARAGNKFTAQGDAQTSDLRVMKSSVDNAVTELTLDGTAPGAGVRIAIVSGKSYDFIIQGVTRCTAGTNINTSATWYITGTIKNVGGTTSLVGSPMNLLSTALFSTAAWTPKAADAALATATLTPTADDVNDALILTFVGVTGVSANTFHTVASVYLTEVG